MSAKTCSFNHVGIVVQNLEESISWYLENLGFSRETSFTFPGAKVAFIRRGELRLEVFQIEGALPIASERTKPETNMTLGGINHFAINVENLDVVVDKLKLKGVETAYILADVPDGSGDRWTFIRDNEGMLIELYQAAS